MKPVIMRMVVDLPAPFGPRKPSTSPRSTVNETSFTATFGPKAFVRFSTVITELLLCTCAPHRRAFFREIGPRPRIFNQPAHSLEWMDGAARSDGTRGGRKNPGRAGADSLTRTDDLPLTRRLLYQLSYAGRASHYTVRGYGQ